MNGQTDKKDAAKVELTAGMLERITRKKCRVAEAEAEKMKAGARAEARKIVAAARSEAAKIVAAAKDTAAQTTKAKTAKARAEYAKISARVAAGEKRLKELNSLLSPKALEAQYSKLTDAKAKAAFRARYAVELGLDKH
jgi:cell division septum initiation protein DivIVA